MITKDKKHIKEMLVGAWQLKIFTVNGFLWRNNHHSNPTGLLIYTNNNFMSVSINANSKIIQTDKDKLDDILFYSGQYSITSYEVITHTVQNASNPERCFESLQRMYILDNNALELTTVNQEEKAYLKWVKLNY